MPKDKSSGKKLADMMYGSDQIRATPQSRVTGPIANALRKAQQFASQYEVSPRIPLLGGTGVDELLSLPEAASLMEDISYNGPGALIRGGNVATGGIGTFRPDPRIASVADVAGTATGVGSLATKGATKGALAAGRAGSRLADRAVPQIMERGGLGADILSGMAQGTQSRIFIGPKAKTFNQAKADEAVRLEQQGVDPAQIWLATGTFRGADGILRQEIDDRAAKFLSANERQERLDATKAKIAEMKQKIKPTPQKDLFPKALNEAKKEIREDISILQGDVKGRERNPRTQGLLAQHIFEHPELYAAYPELQNVKFVTEGGNDGTLGALSIMPSHGFIPGSMEIDIYDKGLRSNPTSTSLHEMQHAVQTLEGMGPGGNPTFAFTDPKAFEMLQQERLKMLKPLPYEDFVRQGGYTDMEQAGKDYAKYTKDLQGGIDPAYDRMLQQRVAMEYYKRLAGEAEARAVQDRQMMTPAQRMETPPPASYDVPQEDLIVKPPREYADGGAVHISDNPGTHDMNNQYPNKPAGGRVYFSDNPDTMMLELARGGAVRMQGGGKPKRIVDAGTKAVKALKEVFAPKDVEPIVVRTAEEQAVLNKFGQKQEQEAARQKKVEKAAIESAGKRPESQAAKPAKSTGKRVAVPPDIYRKMAEEQGEDAVLKAARAGKHLKPTGEGYIGAPRTVTSGQGLGAMRRAMDADFADSVEAVRLADEARLGTWYDRAKQGIAESSEPYQLPRTLEQHGVYSAGVSPESELTFALKHLNSRVAGNPQMAYRGAGMRNLDSAVAEDRPANMGFKIGEYANKNDPRIPNAGLFGVNDFRRAQGMGYTDPQGNPWKAGVSDTMHPFMDAETALQVDRANTAGTGGRKDWAGPHIQEVPWVYGKAQDLYSRGKSGQYAGDELEGIKMALQDANNTARDYMYKHAASATSETIPGASLGHVRQALDMTPEEKIAYGQIGRFDVPPPEAALNEFPEVGAGNRDAIYGALGYRQLPTRQAEGLYINRLGGVETNPMTIARPLMDFPTGGGGLMAPDSRRVMDTAEQFRALMDAQEAGAYNLPNTMGSVKGKNSMVLDTRGRNPDALKDPSAGVLPTSDQLAKMNEVAGKYGFGVTASNRGAVVFPFDYAIDPKDAAKAMRKMSKDLDKIFPSTQEKSLSTMGYVPGVGKRSAQGPLSTLPFSGEATSDLLRAFSELPPTVSQNLSESESVREAIRAKALRDAKMGGTRGDIQETRRFFSEADWPKAVELIRKGMTPAAALAALGYNVNAMAADDQ